MNSDVLENKSSPYTVGMRVPTEPWVQASGETVSLLELRGAPVVLAFFPADWDPGREHQMELFSQAFSIRPQELKLSRASSDTGAIHASLEDGGEFEIPVLDNLDVRGPLAIKLGIEGKQAIFVVDAEGYIVFRYISEHGTLPRADDLVQRLSLFSKQNVSRRQFVFTALATLAASMLIPRIPGAEPFTHSRGPVSESIQTKETYSLNINGHNHTIPADARITVLNALRDYLGMTGTKKGCDHGQCGACTVHVNGRRMNSCLLLAAQAQGSRIETIEGLADGENLHPVQEAFIQHDGFQCGYCTPGQIMSAVACIHEGHTGNPEEIREWMSGNICRCGAYQGILDSVQDAKARMAAK